MKIEELIEEEMYVLVAPDGSTQISTLAPDFAMCVAFTTMLGKEGISEPLHEMLEKGFTIMPVKVTIKANGTEDEGFQKAKKQMKR